MTALQRNQLVWLGDAAWQRMLAREWDAQAHSLLSHWHSQSLPLVVCRQRVPGGPHSLCLGLPAPLQWARRRLALDAVEDDIARVGSFPLLANHALLGSHAAQLQDLLQHMEALQVRLQVYGSFGWQQLCGLPCVREGSDLDLLAHVPDLGTAGQVVWLLQGLKLQWRVDGELVFPNGWALAWREYAQLIGGKVDRVLVKERGGAQLLTMAKLRAELRGERPATACAPAAHALQP
jgi:phosphoribosyl-dephospho-CoA transferase